MLTGVTITVTMTASGSLYKKKRVHLKQLRNA